MLRRPLLKILLLASLLSPLNRVFAQNNDEGAKSPLQLRNAMGTVLIAGLVGGVLGLSTLSFYDSPQDNIRNIFFGAGAGMMVATIVMTADVAAQPIPSSASNDSVLKEKTHTNWAMAPIVGPKAAGLTLALRF